MFGKPKLNSTQIKLRNPLQFSVVFTAINYMISKDNFAKLYKNSSAALGFTANV